jgi:hypothetical protein
MRESPSRPNPTAPFVNNLPIVSQPTPSRPRNTPTRSIGAPGHDGQLTPHPNPVNPVIPSKKRIGNGTRSNNKTRNTPKPKMGPRMDNPSRTRRKPTRPPYLRRAFSRMDTVYAWVGSCEWTVSVSWGTFGDWGAVGESECDDSWVVFAALAAVWVALSAVADVSVAE